jgi:hypothetical protein
MCRSSMWSPSSAHLTCPHALIFHSPVRRSSVSGVLKHDLYVFATKAISETINPSDESALQSSTNLFQMQFESEMLCAEYERLLDDACRALHSHTE